MAATVETIGMDQVIKRIDTVADVKRVSTGLRAAALHVKGKIAKYPPKTIANSPSEMRWYERNYGPRWRRKDGSIGGRKTSESLGKKWTDTTENSGLTVIVGNNVSYAPYVQDEEKQASFHKARGWKTAQGVVRDEMDTIMRFVTSYLDKA